MARMAARSIRSVNPRTELLNESFVGRMRDVNGPNPDMAKAMTLGMAACRCCRNFFNDGQRHGDPLPLSEEPSGLE